MYVDCYNMIFNTTPKYSITDAAPVSSAKNPPQKKDLSQENYNQQKQTLTKTQTNLSQNATKEVDSFCSESTHNWGITTNKGVKAYEAMMNATKAIGKTCKNWKA